MSKDRKVYIGLAVAVLMMAGHWAFFGSSSVAFEAPSEQVPEYTVWDEVSSSKSAVLKVSTHSRTESDVRVIAGDLRYRNPDLDHILIAVHDPEYFIMTGMARAVSGPEAAEEQWGGEYSEEEIEDILEYDQGIDAGLAPEFVK